MAQQFLAIFEPNEQRVVSETSKALLALGPDPSSIVMDSPEGTAYQVFTAYLTNDEAAMSKFFGEFATNTCRQDNGSLVGCMAAIYNSRGLQTLQEWDVRGEDPNELDEIVYFASITTYWAENDTCLQVVFTLVHSQRIWAITDPPTEVSTC
jgi:hypothetical protein